MYEAAGKLTIDLGALAHNYRLIQQKIGGKCRAGAVLKANAYGLGAKPVAETLYAAGCRDFMVARPEEGLAFTDLPRDARVYILNGFYTSASELYLQHGFIPVLGSFMEIEEYRALCVREGRALPAWLKFNTRMNRLGFGSTEQEKLFAHMNMLDGINILGIMSHFACADEAGHPMNNLQYDLFVKIAAHFPNAQKSLCNSSAIFRNDKYHFDLVRPGMALYGLNPTPEAANPMRSVVKLEVPVIRTRIVYPDAAVGYGATYRFEKQSPLATISAGYADGIPWALGNKGKLYWKNYACPVRGRVSMDLTTVDLSAVPENERPRPGDMLEVIGLRQSADELASDSATIGYEILTSLGMRYKRHYINA